MLLFQILVIIFVLFALSRTVMQFRKRKLSVPLLAFWIVFWFALAVVVLLPDTTSRVASLLGITRGVDLVIYLALIALFYLVFRILIKIESLEQEITHVVRREALDREEKKE